MPLLERIEEKSISPDPTISKNKPMLVDVNGPRKFISLAAYLHTYSRNWRQDDDTSLLLISCSIRWIWNADCCVSTSVSIQAWYNCRFWRLDTKTDYSTLLEVQAILQSTFHRCTNSAERVVIYQLRQVIVAVRCMIRNFLPLHMQWISFVSNA